MSEEPKLEQKPVTPEPLAKAAVKRRFRWQPVVMLVVVFLAGFAPMWLKSARLAGELSRAQRELRRGQIQLTFADAVLDARRGDYEPARQRMARFFSRVTGEVDRGIGSALPADAFYDLQPLLDQRDDLITLLARGDPASAERLAEEYLFFRDLLHPGEPARGDDSPAAKPL